MSLPSSHEHIGDAMSSYARHWKVSTAAVTTALSTDSVNQIDKKQRHSNRHLAAYNKNINPSDTNMKSFQSSLASSSENNSQFLIMMLNHYIQPLT